MYDVIVIGGGASGMMAAGIAGQRGQKVLLLEKNKNLGEKLKITGGGRCNITNAEYDQRLFLKHYGEKQDFLFSAFSQFGVKDTFSFFEKLKLPLVIEARLRAFPQSQKASDVCLALEQFLRQNGVTIKTNTKVEKIITEKGKIISVKCGRAEYIAKSFILATGGVSHPETGSTGDGFKWLEFLGHKITSPTPDLVPLAVEENWVKNLAGVSLSFMKISFFLEGKRLFSKTGKILFTHFGLSGPLVMNSSAKIKPFLEQGQVTAKIDAFPETDLGSLDRQILKIFNANKNKTLKNVVKEISPEGMGPGIIVLLSELDLNQKVNEISRDDRKRIGQLFKNIPMTISGLMGYDRAIVSDGGLDLKELDTRTMRSKIVSNLFITGDLLNINRPSGGFSLQLCWTTGYVAGQNA